MVPGPLGGSPYPFQYSFNQAVRLQEARELKRLLSHEDPRRDVRKAILRHELLLARERLAALPELPDVSVVVGVDVDARTHTDMDRHTHTHTNMEVDVDVGEADAAFEGVAATAADDAAGALLP
jgi:hypothetical protein